MKPIKSLFILLVIFLAAISANSGNVYADKNVNVFLSDTAAERLLIVTDQALNRMIIVNTLTQKQCGNGALQNMEFIRVMKIGLMRQVMPSLC